MAPVTIRLGNAVIHCNDIAVLDSVLATLPLYGPPVDGSHSTSTCESIQYLSQDVLEMLADKHGQHFSSMRNALVATRRCISKNLMKKLEAVNSCASFLR